MANDESKLPDPRPLLTRERRQLKKQLRENKKQLLILEGTKEYIGQKIDAQLASQLEQDIDSLRNQIQDIEGRLEIDNAVITKVDHKIGAVTRGNPDPLLVQRFINQSISKSIFDFPNMDAFYITMEEAGRLGVEFDGGRLDLYQFSVVNINLQLIIDKVAFNLLTQSAIAVKLWPRRDWDDYTHIVRAEIANAKIGSFWEELTFAIVSLLNQPDVRSILQNLAANVVWAIGSSGVGKIIQNNITNKALERTKSDPFDVGPNVREILIALAQNCQEQSAELRFIERTTNDKVTEVTFRIDAPQNINKPEIATTEQKRLK